MWNLQRTFFAQSRGGAEAQGFGECAPEAIHRRAIIPTSHCRARRPAMRRGTFLGKAQRAAGTHRVGPLCSCGDGCVNHAIDWTRCRTAGAAALGEHGAPSRSEIAIHLRRRARRRIANAPGSFGDRAAPAQALGTSASTTRRGRAWSLVPSPPYLRSSVSHRPPALRRTRLRHDYAVMIGAFI